MREYNEKVNLEVIRFISDHIIPQGWYEDLIVDHPEGPGHRYHWYPDGFRFEYIAFDVITSEKYYRYSATVPFIVSGETQERQRVSELVQALNKCSFPGAFHLDVNGHLSYQRIILISSDEPCHPVKDELLFAAAVVEVAAPLMLEAIFTRKPISAIVYADELDSILNPPDDAEDF